MIAMSTDALKGFRHAAMAGMAVIALGLAGISQLAAEDEDTFEQTIIKKILGSLGADVGGPGIEYRERSPLVVPPSRELPPPETGTPVAGNPSWPKDPEATPTRKQAKTNPTVYDSLPIEVREGRVLSPDELRKGATPGAGRVANPSQSPREEDIGRRLRPEELGYKGGIFNSLMPGYKPEVAKFPGEPARSSLTQPPPGYQTPSPAQPYGVAETPKSWKIPNLFDRPVGGD